MEGYVGGKQSGRTDVYQPWICSADCLLSWDDHAEEKKDS